MGRVFRSPLREYIIAALVAVFLFFDLISPHSPAAIDSLFFTALLGSAPTFWRAFSAVRGRRITIDSFNSLALAISFVTLEIRSSAFIVLMLTFADLLDWQTESRARRAVEELLKMKPVRAFRERRWGEIEEINVAAVKRGDTLVVKNGGSVPVDGTVIFGRAFVNESLLTGESVPVEKVPGDRVFGSAINESGLIKVKATGIGKDSTVEKMAGLMREAAQHKSRSEKLADRFAAVFLPIVLLLGIGVYFFTRNILMTAALFLVACADDMAVAIPLAIRAALGRAAKRGVIVKGGEWLEKMSRAGTVVLDKTGTLTYGKLIVRDVWIETKFKKNDFWGAVATAEKFSEHPVGRAIMKEAARHISRIPDPKDFKVYAGSGVRAAIGRREILVGDEKLLAEFKIRLTAEIRSVLKAERQGHGETSVIVAVNKKIAGVISVSDVPRPEVQNSLRRLAAMGAKNIIMFTGDRRTVAETIAKKLGIRSFRASMKPEDKLSELEKLEGRGVVVMVGDGINDAPALARADVGIAMGGEGAAITSEAADIVILTDDLSRIPEVMLLSRRTLSVIRGDMFIWLLSNLAGFVLVLTGVAGPALAAFYNFATDFLPLLNSARLFKS